MYLDDYFVFAAPNDTYVYCEPLAKKKQKKTPLWNVLFVIHIFAICSTSENVTSPDECPSWNVLINSTTNYTDNDLRVSVGNCVFNSSKVAEETGLPEFVCSYNQTSDDLNDELHIFNEDWQLAWYSSNNYAYYLNIPAIRVYNQEFAYLFVHQVSTVGHGFVVWGIGTYINLYPHPVDPYGMMWICNVTNTTNIAFALTQGCTRRQQWQYFDFYTSTWN
ncbi:hypothetical protein RFI_39467, partial [Reticulomyxa filosa]